MDMSKWQEAGFPDRIRMSSPLKVAAALLAAVNERRATWGLQPLETMKRFTPFSYYNPSGFYSSIDFAAVDDCDIWTIPELARDFSGEYPTWKNFTKDSLAEAIGEEIIEGKKELSPRFFAEWALQRYKILNLFYIRWAHSFGGTIGKSRGAKSYEGFGKAVGELNASEWSSGYYLTRGASTESYAYDGTLDSQRSVWTAEQNCCSWVDQIRAYTPQSVEHWGRVGRGQEHQGGMIRLMRRDMKHRKRLSLSIKEVDKPARSLKFLISSTQILSSASGICWENMNWLREKREESMYLTRFRYLHRFRLIRVRRTSATKKRHAR